MVLMTSHDGPVLIEVTLKDIRIIALYLTTTTYNKVYDSVCICICCRYLPSIQPCPNAVVVLTLLALNHAPATHLTIDFPKPYFNVTSILFSLIKHEQNRHHLFADVKKKATLYSGIHEICSDSEELNSLAPGQF